MDEKETVKEILSSYDEIKILEEKDGIIFFELHNNEYGFLYSSKEEPTENPTIIIKDYERYDCPHIMLSENTLYENKYRVICLHEDGSVISYLQSYEEKIIDIIDRLIELLSLSPLEIEVEFQKEFLFYWNNQAKYIVETYISPERVFQKMNMYINKNKNYRFVSLGIKLHDKNNFSHVPNINIYYIPIIDNRGILPHFKNKPWDVADILKVIKGRDYKRISSETYNAIKTEKLKENNLILIFEMIINNQRVAFGVMIEFKKSAYTTIFDKIENSISNIVLINIKRRDYYFLNSQIGNDTSVIGKNVAIIGAGSLGSYVAGELVKSGVKKIALYDDDIIEAVNVLRHNVDFFWSGYSKVLALKYELEHIHPEIIVEANNENITKEILRRDMSKYDLIIFTVGSSDVQLMANKFFKKENFKKPVIYAWLEAGGVNSHLLYIDYLRKGCFECLYTDVAGNLINNKVNKMSDEQVEINRIRNGCGGTRVAYGTDILLRTTSVVLNLVKRVFNEDLNENTLYDIKPDATTEQGSNFIERKCKCCSD